MPSPSHNAIEIGTVQELDFPAEIILIRIPIERKSRWNPQVIGPFERLEGKCPNEIVPWGENVTKTESRGKYFTVLPLSREKIIREKVERKIAPFNVCGTELRLETCFVSDTYLGEFSRNPSVSKWNCPRL
jgi:hypothetical protein